MSQHAVFAPSASVRWLNCDLCAQLEKLFISVDSAASIEGTQKHDEAANHLEAGTDSDNKKLQIYLDAVRALPGELYVEHKLTIVPDLCWGRTDALVVNFDEETMTVADLKWGKSPVKPVMNKQLMVYSLGALREFLLPREAMVKIMIIQPNAKGGRAVKPWQVSVDQLLQFRVEVLEAIERSVNLKLEYNVGGAALGGNAGPHCFWCKGKLHCDAYLKTH